MLAWWISRRTLSGLDFSRQNLRLLTRCLVLALFCAALAEPRIRWRSDTVSVVAILDVSDSIPAGQKRLADEFLRGSLRKRPEQDGFGMVTVARDALVQSLPTSHQPTTDCGSTGRTDSSRIQQGVDLALALIPEDSAGRLLLLSDGNQTDGNLATAASGLLAAGIPIDVASVEYDRSAIVRVEDVVVPSWVRDGDVITARIVFSSGRAARGRLNLLLDGEPVDLDPDSASLSLPVELAPGVEVLSQTLRLPPGSAHRVEAIFEPEDKAAAIPQLLRAEGVTFTSNRGRILLLADDRRAAAPLVAAISSDNLKVEVRHGSEAPIDLADWSGYDAVVLFDQPASIFSQAQQQDLARYVHDTAGGLLVVGGPNSFGAGGWISSPLADALPIILDPPQKRQMPLGALAIVIDRSGSMGQPVTGTGMNQQQIANEAAILGARTLSRLDHLAVIAFDGASDVIVPLTPLLRSRRHHAEHPVHRPWRRHQPLPRHHPRRRRTRQTPRGDQAHHHPYRWRDRRRSQRRPADRRPGPHPEHHHLHRRDRRPVQRRPASAPGHRRRRSLSRRRGARTPAPSSRRSSSRRLRPSAARSSGRDQVSRRARAEDADSLRGFAGAFPSITGYVVSADRGGLSTVPLRGPENDPILAQWQHGLGRVTTYASDATKRWNAAWASWGSFGPFWQQQLKWVMRPGGDPNARVVVTAQGARSRVGLELVDAAGEPVNFATIQSRITPPPGAEDPAPRDVVFRQVGPGRYEADVNSSTPGSSLVSLRYDAPIEGSDQRRAGSVRAAVVRRASDELRQPSPNTALLMDIAHRTGGRVYQLDPRGADLWVACGCP